VAARKVMNLHGEWVFPGLIDAHLHVCDGDAAHRMLAHGITTGRSMLTDDYEDVELKKRAQKNESDIPQILAAGFMREA
jgi:predicted amidohydrolase YtcJ